MATQPEPVSPSWRITFPNTFALGRERQLLIGSCCPWLYVCLRGSCGEKLPQPLLFHMLFIGLQFNKPFKSSLKLSVSSKGMLVSSTVHICGQIVMLAAHNPRPFTYSPLPTGTEYLPVWLFFHLSSFCYLGRQIPGGEQYCPYMGSSGPSVYREVRAGGQETQSLDPAATTWLCDPGQVI